MLVAVRDQIKAGLFGAAAQEGGPRLHVRADDPGDGWGEETAPAIRNDLSCDCLGAAFRMRMDEATILRTACYTCVTFRRPFSATMTRIEEIVLATQTQGRSTMTRA